MEELCRSFDITDLSAEDLEDVRLILKMKVYAIVSISGDPFIDPNRWYSTAVDYQGRTCPRWNNTFFHFTLHDPSLFTNRLHLMFRFYCERTFHHNRYIGGITAPVKCLFDLAGVLDSFYHVSFPVKLPSGGEKGFLKLSFRFGKSLPRLIRPAPPWPPQQLPRNNTFSHEEPPQLYSGYPSNDPCSYIHSRQQACDYDHQRNDLHANQVQYAPYNCRSRSLPSAPSYDQINSSGSLPSSFEHYPDSDKDDAYYSSGSYDDESDR
ncbi:hypothetical protein PVL29_008595 [Vitis rotundifolia]|uniref:C2 domain-containing protein n=1 Tax=Vitis rotundifolia TaxID=103349 RepID=A0AA39DUD8_VITRO|nr:hypothetical protein PVL29_008595 [Vitis rotundifolia]